MSDEQQAHQPMAPHVDVFRLESKPPQSKGSPEFAYEYPPRIPVAMRHPYPTVNSVKQYTKDRQHEQLKQHIVSESFIPVSPEAAEKPQRRSRRRPPFSYSSLIAQAILATDNKRMTLRDIYRWIMDKYPALYNAQDTGWQNTIRHNLSLNKCFKKVPKSDITPEENRGKGGFWTLDPEYMSQYTNGAFARGSIANRRSTHKRSGPGSDSDSHTGNYQESHPTSPSSRARIEIHHSYSLEESDISSPTSSPSLLRMSPVTPPRSSVTVRSSPTGDHPSSPTVNTVYNTTPIEHTVENLGHPMKSSDQSVLPPPMLDVLSPSPPPTVPHLDSVSNESHLSSPVMRIDNLLN